MTKAEISTYLANIESAAKGEQVRDSIIRALQAINDSLEGTEDSATMRAVRELFLNGTLFDTEPVEESTKAVTSGGLYEIIGDIGLALDVINGVSV